MVDISELETLISKLSDKKLLARAASNSLFNASQYIAGESVKDNNHRYKTRTGTLGNSVTNTVKGLSSEILIDLKRAPYGLFVYEGTKDHVIKPKNKKALSWVQGNQRFFSKGHKVKGWKADTFILNTFNKKRSIFTKIMAEDLTEQIEEIIS